MTPVGAGAVGHCPGCGGTLAFVQEFWAADERRFLCWCSGCGLTSTVVLSPALVGTEPEH